MLRDTFIVCLVMVNKTIQLLSWPIRQCRLHLNSVLQSISYSFISGVLNGSVESSVYAAPCCRKIGG